MRVGFVGFGHLVDIFATFDGRAGAIGGVDDLGGQFVFHLLLAAESAVGDEPAEAEGLLALGADFHRDLVVGGADSANLEFDFGHDVADRGGEDVHRGFLGLLFDLLEGLVDDGLGGAALAIVHDAVDQAGNEFGVIYWVGKDITFLDSTFSWYPCNYYRLAESRNRF